MHIALTVTDLSGGGAERSVLSLAEGLIYRGHQVDIVMLRTRVRYFDEIPEDARLYVVEGGPDGLPDEVLARIVRLHARPTLLDWLRVTQALHWDPLCLCGLPMVRQVRALASYMELVQPDCVLPNLSRPNTATLLAGCLLTKQPPIIPTIHSFVPSHRYRTKRRYRHLAGTATHFVGVSRGVSESLASTIGVPTSSITTIYNPVVTPRLHIKMAERPNHPWLLDGGPPVVLSVGRLVTAKDYPTLIKAFARLAEQRPCRLIILGEGKRRNELEGLVQGLRIHDRVALPGWEENPFAFMSHASLFVLSSISEGLSGVLVQALACGCPCVSTDCPVGPAEVLANGKFGPLVPPGDDLALAKAMERVLTKPPERRLLQQRAADFSADKTAATYEKLISESLC